MVTMLNSAEYSIRLSDTVLIALGGSGLDQDDTPAFSLDQQHARNTWYSSG